MDSPNLREATMTLSALMASSQGALLAATTSVEKRIGLGTVASTEVWFGPFCLLPTQFLLLEGDKRVLLGSRALEILIALIERRGELISNQDLMARVWPKVFVEPANLTVHMSALRRALRDGRDGHRFIVNIPGRGYCFVASVEVLGNANWPTRVAGATKPRQIAPNCCERESGASDSGSADSS